LNFKHYNLIRFNHYQFVNKSIQSILDINNFRNIYKLIIEIREIRINDNPTINIFNNYLSKFLYKLIELVILIFTINFHKSQIKT
jgi:hypothetical protein